MAVELIVRLHLRCAHYILLVEHNFVVLVHSRSWAHRFSDMARISRWYDESFISTKNIYANVSIAETLDRFEVPFFGPLASSILDDE